MNVLAITPHLVLTMLQGQNIKRDIVKKVDLVEKNIQNLKKILLRKMNRKMKRLKS